MILSFKPAFLTFCFYIPQLLSAKSTLFYYHIIIIILVPSLLYFIPTKTKNQIK